MQPALATEFPNDNPLLGSGAACASARGRARPVRGRMIAVMPYLLVPEGAVLPPVLAAEAAALAAPAAAAPTRPELPAVETETAALETASVEERQATEPEARGPIERLLAAMVAAAQAGGDTRAAALLPEVLLEGRLSAGLPAETLSALSAWRSVLSGASGDLGACGASTLDTWAAELICALSGSPSTRVGDYRRELRRRGVAAFGLIDV